MKVVVISGPTASGKTNISLELAKKFGGEIVNFDSLLFYQEISIGTAKPTLEELKDIPHHMVNIRSISSPMNAADYAAMALPIVKKLLAEKKLVYLVGGSGFYLQALLKGMYDSPTTPEEIRKKSDELYSKEGITPFIQILKQNDPLSFERYHENDHYRVRRAVEHFWTHATPLSKVREEKDQSNQNLNASNVHGWDLLHLHLDLPKEEHSRIIENRTQKMLEAGLEKEVRDLLDQGFSGLEKPLQSIGYKEILDHIWGLFKSERECFERIIISTRQLAKSQRTWFKRDLNLKTFHPLKEHHLILNRVQEFLNEDEA